MLGNSLIKFLKGNFGTQENWWDSLSKKDKGKYNKKIKRFNELSLREDFDLNKWKGFSDFPKEAQNYFKTVKKGKATQEGLNKAMSKTMQVTTASGEAFVSSGNKIKDLGSVIKNSAISGLKGFGKALLGSGLNTLINGAIGAVIEGGINAWQKYSNVQENAIAKSSDAVSKLQANQNKIKSAEEVLSSIKENKVIDSSGNEITRFEQLSQGVNSLKEMNNWVDAGIEQTKFILRGLIK